MQADTRPTPVTLTVAEAPAAAPAAPLTGKPMLLAGTAPSYSGTGSSLASMAGSLVLVLGLIFVFAWLMRRVQGLRPAGGSTLRIEGGLQVGAKERVVVLQAGDTRLLLGVTAGSISVLHRLSDAGATLAVEEGQPEAALPPSFQQAFGEQLDKLLGRK
ncbi:flagellar biosynthetic protein FliO [Solimonas sp. K1W22B-7]|uniref:flagellar biosynthetic protein FliO n=1 Tax=Solimonas sp. K1W22B-7 TaxID=2303331 RepID=UPI000E332DE3|nr:flagellar biosynthetic protein FliO [Solimonas sp. K1W22B-7]AXQ28197.1 flagellar biosynthetic protein FliO [Solimonas sp. K1W22B-7]